MPWAQRVVLFVIDGLRPDALLQASTPRLDQLAARGTRATAVSTVYPSITLPCHASLFFSVPPARHGVVSNIWQPPPSPVPSLTEVVHQNGLGTAAFYSWEELRDMAPPGALDAAYFRDLHCITEQDPDVAIAEVAASTIPALRPAFAFVYLGATDEVGHKHGWMSPSYLQAVGQADRAVGIVVDALRGSGLWSTTACVVLADHGGHDHDHAGGLADDMAVPWLACGPGIRPGDMVGRPLSIIDTAPTILHLLGLPAPGEWEGQVIREALVA